MSEFSIKAVCVALDAREKMCDDSGFELEGNERKFNGVSGESEMK
jgi:hypothetical protein